MTKELPQSPDGVRELRLAWQKTRSVAAEGGYLDLLEGQPGIRGLDPFVGNPKTLDMLLDFESGAKDISDRFNWANLVRLVGFSESWDVGLRVRGYHLPNTSTILLGTPA